LKKVFLIFFVLLLSAVGWGGFDAHRFLNSPLIEPEKAFELEVKQGDTIRGLASQLSAKGLLERPLWWEIYARYTGQARSIKTGEYPLSSAITPMQLLTSLQAGKQKQYSLTILEGWNIWQLRSAVAADSILVQTMDGVSDADVMKFIGAADGHPEGQFLPDTYHFPRGTTDAQFLYRAHKALTQELQQQWSERAEDLPADSPYEALIMASIIEKETSVADERELIAGVIAGRLRKGMRLQMDPTVIYGIGREFNGNITRRDLKNNTPYNTYTIDGLPPTPIAMAGAGSIRAALHPAATTALFFVADGTGGHVFNDTVEEHNKAVRKFILKKK